MKKSLFFLLLVFVNINSFSQIIDPVKWDFSFEKISDSEINLVFKATIDKGWHLYGLNIPENGPIPTNFVYDNAEKIKFIGKPVAKILPEVKYDSILEMKVELLEKNGLFKQKIRVTGEGDIIISGYVEYMACNDNTCTPPLEKEFNIQVPVSQISKADIIDAAVDSSTVDLENSDDSLITRETTFDFEQPQPMQEKKNPWNIFLISIIAGLGALLTPCVYPMIPMTVSFFMRGAKSRGQSVAEASVFGLSIILIYTLLGVLVAIFKDPNAVNNVSTHWLLNSIFFIIFIILAASFFGMFELVLPSGFANKIDRQADRGGLAGAFFMALGMTILSFSCTGPIVASLLIKASEGEVIEPVIGMFGFGLIFAIPFTLFAIFPSWLKSLPKSGSWLNAVKVFIAFILLAFSLYFLGKIDQTYHLNLLSRELYIGFWIVVFTLLGFYLIGKIRFPHDSPLESISVPRFFLAVITFTFVLYLITGFLGKDLSFMESLLPPKKANYTNSVTSGVNVQTNALCNTPKYSDFLHLPHNLAGYFDYEEALACAKEKNKPVLIDFVGHSCANCKKMYQKVWSDQRVLEYLKNDFIVVALYTDDKTKLSQDEIYTSKIDGREKNTIGKKNVDFQIEKFNSNALPLYAIVNPEGEVITSVPYYVYNPDTDKFISFLKDGLTKK